MNALSFGNGSKTFVVNESVEISFNPASSQFCKELMDTVERCQQIMEQTKAQQERVEADKKAVFDIAQEQDAKICQQIDNLFGTGKAAQLFPWGATAWSDGLPVWLNFCLAVLDEVAQSVTEQQSKAEPRLQKYLDKYQKYQKR